MMKSWWIVGVTLFAGVFLLAGPSLAEQADYVGYQKCKGCHSYQFKIWQEAKHAKATEALGADKKSDATCLACHSTGASAGKNLEGVQCEACHGPGSLYKSPKIMSKSKYKKDSEGQRKMAMEAGLVLPDEKLCVQCHKPERPEGHPAAKPFKFEEAAAKIDHKKK